MKNTIKKDISILTTSDNETIVEFKRVVFWPIFLLGFSVFVYGISSVRETNIVSNVSAIIGFACLIKLLIGRPKGKVLFIKGEGIKFRFLFKDHQVPFSEISSVGYTRDSMGRCNLHITTGGRVVVVANSVSSGTATELQQMILSAS